MKSIDEIYKDFPDEVRDKSCSQRSKTGERELKWSSIPVVLFSSLIILLIVCIGSEVLIQSHTVSVGPRKTVFTNWQYAMELLERDLGGCILSIGSSRRTARPTAPGGNPQKPSDVIGPAQALWMENGFLQSPGTLPLYGVGAPATDRPGDRMGIRTTGLVGDTVRSCEVTYELIHSDMTLDHLGNLRPGYDSSHNESDPARQFFTLIRRVRTVDPNSSPAVYDQFPQYRDRVTGALVRLIDQELCHYVLSFNLEYYSNEGTFSELDPSPFPRVDSIARAPGANDSPTPYRTPLIRITLVLGDGSPQGQEQTIQRVFSLPGQ